MTKLTAGSAAVFMLTSLALAVASSRQHSVFDATPEPTPISAPAPAAPADSGTAGLATGEATIKLGGEAPAAEQGAGSGAAANDLGPAGQAGSAGQAADTGAPAGKAPADAAPANAPAAGTEGQ